MRAQWVNIIFGIWDRRIHRVVIHDDDRVAAVDRGEQLVRMPASKYRTLTSDKLEQELML